MKIGASCPWALGKAGQKSSFHCFVLYETKCVAFIFYATKCLIRDIFVMTGGFKTTEGGLNSKFQNLQKLLEKFNHVAWHLHSPYFSFITYTYV
jgi:hypothetical protein